MSHRNTTPSKTPRPIGVSRMIRWGLAVLLIAACAAGTGISKTKSATKAIKIDGGTETRKNLAIYSELQGECAVSVTNNGSLTLSDSAITKIGNDSRMGSDGGQGEAPGGMPGGGLPEGMQGGAPGGMPGGEMPEGMQGGAPAGMPGGEMPEGMQEGAPGGMPGGEMPEGMQGGAPGGMPDGEMPEGMQEGAPGSMPGGEMPEGMQDGSPGGMPGGMQQGQPGPGAQNSGVYAESGGSVTLSDVTINTKLGEGKGLYASGAGSRISLADGKITTNGNTAHGIYITYGGAIALENTTITTEGAHSSVLATDKGGGIITARGGKYRATGSLSAGIYSTGLVKATDAEFYSASDYAAAIEGGNQIYLTDCRLTAATTGGVMIYQSFSGDAAVGKADFTMIGGALTAKEGPLFYVTNTATTITLKNVKLSGTSGEVLKAIKGQWGADAPGADRGASQGGTVDFYAEQQTLTGDIVVDEDGAVNAFLKAGSRLKGAVNAENKSTDVNLYLDASSTWEVTADSYLNRIRNAGGFTVESVSNIIGNGHTVFYNGTANSALSGRTFQLKNGGTLQPL